MFKTVTLLALLAMVVFVTALPVEDDQAESLQTAEQQWGGRRYGGWGGYGYGRGWGGYGYGRGWGGYGYGRGWGHRGYGYWG